MRHLQVQRSRTLADTAGRVVVGTVARTVVATEVTGVGDRDTAQMRAHADNNEPFRLLDALLKEESAGIVLERIALYDLRIRLLTASF